MYAGSKSTSLNSPLSKNFTSSPIGSNPSNTSSSKDMGVRLEKSGVLPGTGYACRSVGDLLSSWSESSGRSSSSKAKGVGGRLRPEEGDVWLDNCEVGVPFSALVLLGVSTGCRAIYAASRLSLPEPWSLGNDAARKRALGPVGVTGGICVSINVFFTTPPTA